MGDQQSKANNDPPELITRNACDKGKHLGQEFNCMKKECKATLCIYCAPKPDINNEVFCKLCRLVLANIHLQDSSEEED